MNEWINAFVHEWFFSFQVTVKPKLWKKNNPCKQETVKKIRKETSISKNQAIPCRGGRASTWWWIDQRQRDLLPTEIAVTRISPLSWASSLSPNSHRTTWKRSVTQCTHSGLFYRRGALNSGNLNLLKWTVSMPLCSRGRHNFSRLYAIQTSWTNSPEQSQSVPLLTGYAEMQGTHGELSHNMM